MYYTSVIKSALTNKETNMKTVIECSRCAKGFIRCFSQIEGGVCFTCNGTGNIEVNIDPVKHWQPKIMKVICKQSKILDAISKLTGYEPDYITTSKILESQLIEVNSKIEGYRLLSGCNIIEVCINKVYDNY
ncbi:hypothetical protein S14_230 [Shewanella sp. phage 1/4]|uniref:hypothetical protein n=1 Tax=Shewanella phage 1/4 TaxID=1458859 RepID=UPI0004F6F228|nr:hypothetical protein S14_230 [Shewanella sp. phage 1/4]AHK11339.1 hypothetical protein S14_230 [Shewanella sp. phage 1/4]